MGFEPESLFIIKRRQRNHVASKGASKVQPSDTRPPECVLPTISASIVPPAHPSLARQSRSSLSR